MKFEFDKITDNFLKIILKSARDANLRVFFAGGIVRDNILGAKTSDIDLLVLGNAIEFSRSLPSEIKVKSIHKDFCTAKLEYKNIQIDIASSRSEIYPYSGCLPHVESVGVELEKDVLRRDFRVNSIYCELKLIDDEIEYELIDLVCGVCDIQNKLLCVLHNNSYIDDPTRIIRGVGFKHRFGFDFCNNDKKLIDDYFKNINYENMSHDRNLKVFRKVLNNKFQNEIFREIVEKKYYKIINSDNLSVDFDSMSKISELFGLKIEQNSDFMVKILLNEPQNKQICATLLEIYRNYSKFAPVDLAYYFYKTKDNDVLKFYKIKDIKLSLKGADLLAFGYKQGVIIGEILDKLLSLKLENPSKFSDKESEIKFVLKEFPQK